MLVVHHCLGGVLSDFPEVPERMEPSQPIAARMNRMPHAANAIVPNMHKPRQKRMGTTYDLECAPGGCQLRRDENKTVAIDLLAPLQPCDAFADHVLAAIASPILFASASAATRIFSICTSTA